MSGRPIHYELIIIGAGPSGLAAALYAAREGMKTLVLEKAIVGGMAAITATIDNYPGFDKGIGGLELADRLLSHAQRFGATIETGSEVTNLQPLRGHIKVTTPTASYLADAVLIATGSSFRRLHVAGEAAMIGRGVHFCATCDAPLYRGKDVIVVGGGNSAMQESLFIAKFAKHLTVLVRDAKLTGTEAIRRDLKALPNVSIKYNTDVRAILSDGHKVTGVRTETASGKDIELPTDGVFVFVGLRANTAAFDEVIKVDNQGFIITKPDFSTSLPGVYAAGDVRSGATWQIASAAGEGVSAVLTIRGYLAALRHDAHLARNKLAWR